MLKPMLFRNRVKAACLTTLVAVALLTATPLAKQGAGLRITAPGPDVIVSGSTRIEVAIEPASEIANIKTVTFSVNGRLACMLERPPFTTCAFEPGDVIRGHHIRVVATLKDGRRLVDNLRTKEIGYAEKIRTSAVLVPLIVTNGGMFVKGLKQQDFEIYEDGIRQPIDSLVTDDAPLDLVLAIDVSGSMERALVDVKPAVKQLLSRLRTGDAATLVGFNDTMFVAAEREKDRRTREDAVIAARQPLRLDQSLAAARRTAVPVRISGPFGVERLDQLLSLNRQLLQRPEGEVFDQLRVRRPAGVEREAAARLAGPIVTCIRGSRGVSIPYGSGERAP